MADSQPTLSSLAAKITELSDTFTRYLKENNVPQPSFAADSPTSYSNLSAEIFMTRQALLDAVNDMWYLTQGPSESIFNYVHCVSFPCLFFLAVRVMSSLTNFYSACPMLQP